MRLYKKTKQFGITTLELLLSLTLISSITAMTLEMAEQAEQSINEYQAQTDIRQALKKIHAPKIKNSAELNTNQNEELKQI